jgi:transposase-like protein
MFQKTKGSPEVQPKPERRRFNAAYKRQIVAEAATCQHGELGSLLRREGLTYTQLSNWRTAQAEGTLTDKPRGPKANPDRAAMRRLEAENARLMRKLGDAEAIIEAQKKLAALLDRRQEEMKK